MDLANVSRSWPDYGEERVVHDRSRSELRVEAVERWRGMPGTRRMPGARGQVTQRENSPSAAEREARRAMHAEEIEEDGIARLQVEPADVERIPVSLDVGNLGQAALGKPLGLPQQEGARQQPRPAVRAGDDLQAASGGTGSTGIQALTPGPSTL